MYCTESSLHIPDNCAVGVFAGNGIRDGHVFDYALYRSAQLVTAGKAALTLG